MPQKKSLKFTARRPIPFLGTPVAGFLWPLQLARLSCSSWFAGIDPCLFGQREFGFVPYTAAYTSKSINPLINYDQLSWYTPRFMDELLVSQLFSPTKSRQFWGITGTQVCAGWAIGVPMVGKLRQTQACPSLASTRWRVINPLGFPMVFTNISSMIFG